MATKKMSQIVIPAFALCSVDHSFALENFRLTYPSMSSSVFYFVIFQKEGYYEEEGLNVEILSIRGEIAIKTALARRSIKGEEFHIEGRREKRWLI